MTLDAHVRRHAVDLSLRLDEPGVTALFGPSGAGKTTVLRVLAGLERTAGHVHWDDEVWEDADRFVPPRHRRVGYLFQDHVLFPHLDVTQNVLHGLRHLPRGQRRARAEDALALAGAAHLAGRRVTGLSGGEGQRVALARALAPRPRLLLLDEPLSALDAPTRSALRHDLRVALQQSGVPTVLVTHDRTEAMALADLVVVVSEGRLLQQGSPQEVFGRPASAEAAAVVGVETVLAGVVTHHDDDLVGVRLGDLDLLGTAADERPAVGSDAMVCVRAEDVHLSVGDATEARSARNQLPGRVTALRDEGALTRVDVDCGVPLLAYVTRRSVEDLALAPGVAVTASIKAPHVHVVERPSPLVEVGRQPVQ